MTPRSIAVAVLASALFALPGAEHCFCAPVQNSDPLAEFRQTLQELAAYPPDPCDSTFGKDEDATDVESKLVQWVDDIVVQELNATSSEPGSAPDRAAEALKKLEQMSAEINAAWPEEKRFHFQILDLPPALAVQLTIRSHARFFVLGIPAESSGKPNQLWEEVGWEFRNPPTSLDLYPLHRGPSGNPRFLADERYLGCAGMSEGIEYDAYEWSPKDATGEMEKIIKQSGSLGIDGGTGDFPEIGVLRTTGPLITLPYCWFSPIDTWDHPNLCAVDTYDVSGDYVRFRSRVYNRPDLVPVDKSIEYAQKHDYPAVRAYCTSDKVARRMVRDNPPSFFADDIRVTRHGAGKEHIQMDDCSFDVEKRGGRWLLVEFNAIEACAVFD